MGLMNIGAFAERTRLSQRALRLYDQLGVLEPAHVDPATKYRLYDEDQVETARLVAQLRRIKMPLATITAVLTLSPDAAARAIASYWDSVESSTNEGRALVAYLQQRLGGAATTDYDIRIRAVAPRRLASISRHVKSEDLGAFFDDAFLRLRALGEGLQGADGAPFLIFYGDVSDDGDGPVELCRPLSSRASHQDGGGTIDIQLLDEPPHDEAYLGLEKKDMGWPVMLPAVDALVEWVSASGRFPSGPLRQVLIADQRRATPQTLSCLLSVPLG